MTADTAALKRLWMQAFEDPEEVADAFFATAFSPARHTAIWENGIPVSALYWFDCSCQGSSFAYIYAVATDSAFRGQGYAGKLLEATHKQLTREGYAGAVLVPGEPWLFAFYHKYGYRVFSTVREFSCTQGKQPADLWPLDSSCYAKERQKHLPAEAILQEGAALDFLQTQAEFYGGNDFLLAASRQGDTLVVHELLGNSQAAPSILTALKIPEGRFRTPGSGRDFAMLLPLRNDCPTPSYFGLALD